ncbi:hypothetical protein JX265_012794 [Neoarthrinium moseri]|uniref:Fibronectin type-III domain-containing protein n=1 Tax=Neoarthrinium moseri TaxID=1658444 RepID=A0A9P9WA28_9PEZI|nr:hypothetical protein JX265_012794 [Neoarthrinium moseri]
MGACETCVCAAEVPRFLVLTTGLRVTGCGGSSREAEAAIGTWNIDRYQIITFDKDTAGAYIEDVSTKGQSAEISELIPGHHYSVWIATWTDKGGGLPVGARAITVRAGAPQEPDDLKVISTDSTTVQLQWTGSSAAARYRWWTRNISDGSASTSSDPSSTDVACHFIGWLFPGVWNFEFCVSGYDGVNEFVKGNCVIANRNYMTAASCPTYSSSAL